MLDEQHKTKTTLLSAFSRKTQKSANLEKISSHVLRGLDDPNEPVLRVNGITKSFGDFVAVDNVSFEIAKKERVAIIGANGAGKTTLTEIIAGLAKPTSGTLEYGFTFNKSPQESIGMQFQKSDYPSGLTVRDMIGFADNLRKLKTTPERLAELLNTFQMEDFYKRKAKNLSGGQKQKLNILMSVLHKPKLIILDELSTGLDISAREEIIGFTDKLLISEGMSAIVISHHFEEIEKLCSRIIAMDRGKIVRIDSTKNLIAEFGTLEKYAKSLINSGNQLAKEKAAEVATVDKNQKSAAKKAKLKDNQNSKANDDEKDCLTSKKP